MLNLRKNHSYSDIKNLEKMLTMNHRHLKPLKKTSSFVIIMWKYEVVEECEREREKEVWIKEKKQGWRCIGAGRTERESW